MRGGYGTGVKEIKSFVDNLPDFGSIKECPKCGNTGQFFSRYESWPVRIGEREELIQVMCGSCGWVGQTKTKDRK